MWTKNEKTKEHTNVSFKRCEYMEKNEKNINSEELKIDEVNKCQKEWLHGMYMCVCVPVCVCVFVCHARLYVRAFMYMHVHFCLNLSYEPVLCCFFIQRTMPLVLCVDNNIIIISNAIILCLLAFGCELKCATICNKQHVLAWNWIHITDRCLFLITSSCIRWIILKLPYYRFFES